MAPSCLMDATGLIFHATKPHRRAQGLLRDFMDAEEFLTALVAAKRANMSVSSIYEACKHRRLAHYKMSGRGRRGKILIRPADLQAFVESQRVEAGKPLLPLRHITLAQPS